MAFEKRDQVDGYSGVAKFYDIFDNKPNIQFYKQVAKNNKLILDVGAGTGRISIPLAMFGNKIWAIEPSQDMIKIFRMKLNNFTQLIDKIHLMRESASSFKLGPRFDLAILSGVFDHFLNYKEQRLSLQNIRRHLKLGGQLAFDAHLGLLKKTEKRKTDTVVIKDKVFERYIQTKLLDDELMETTLEFFVKRGDQIIENHLVKSLTRVNTSQEILDLVNDLNFTIIGKFMDYKFSPFKHGAGLIVVYAEKKG